MDGAGKSATFDKKIVKQLEFYFSDTNLPHDKFLLQKLEEDEGWVTIDCLLSFPRFKSIVIDIIENALKTEGSGLLEFDETKTKLHRTKPLPEFNDEYNMEAKEKTIFCEGFPGTTTLDDLEGFFEGKGKCVKICMRRLFDEKRSFKGSVFAEFETKEDANAFVAMKDLKYKENELTYMLKDDYFKSKKKKYGENKDKNVVGTDINKDKNEEVDYPKGRVLHFNGVGDQSTREEIREIFNIDNYQVKWVTFNTGEKEGFIRYDNDAEKAMKALMEKNNNKVMIRDVETTLRLVEGDEEKDYWIKAKEDMARVKNKGKYSRGHMKRGRNNSMQKRDEPPAKQAKSNT